MKTFAIWWEKKRESVLFSVLVNGLMLASLLVLFRPAYETNDDMAMALLVNGARGTYDAHLIISSYVLGRILSVLYWIKNTLPWYSLVQYAAVFCSYTAIFYVVRKRLKNSFGMWVSLIVLYFFAYEGYIRAQYTKTAGIAAAAGALLLLDAAVRHGKGIWKSLVAGYLLACTGFLYRPEQFLAVFALMSAVGVFMILERAGEKERLRKFLLRCFGIFGPLAGMVAGLFVMNWLAYQPQEWKDYMEYNDLRTELFDYGFPDFKENKEAYQELGINRTAYRMFRSWNHVDTEKFTSDIMRQLIALKPPKKVDAQFFFGFFRKLAAGLPFKNCFLCFMAVLFLRLCRRRFTRNDVVVIAYELAILAALYFYLYYEGRFLINRVDVSLWLAASLVLLWTFPETRDRFSKYMELAAVIGTLCLTQYLWRGSWRIRTEGRVASMQTMRSVAETVHEDTDHLYLVKMGTLTFSGSYGVFDQVPFNISGNVLPLGGWTTMTPWYCELMEKWGIENPFPDLVGNEKLYLIDDDVDGTLKYLRKCYGRPAEAVLVREFPAFNVYQIVPSKEE